MKYLDVEILFITVKTRILPLLLYFLFKLNLFQCFLNTEAAIGLGVVEAAFANSFGNIYF